MLGSDTVGPFGWCGTCYSDTEGKAGFCKHHDTIDNATNAGKYSEDQKRTENPDEFSRPTSRVNWGFCSENCLKLSHNQGYSEVNCHKIRAYLIHFYRENNSTII